MGFPSWTLWGIGLSAFMALLAMLFAYTGQSPNTIHRLGRMGQLLKRRARMFTGLGVAWLMLGLGFFVAGVPLEGVEPTAVAETQGTSNAPFTPFTPIPSESSNVGATDLPEVTPELANEGDEGMESLSATEEMTTTLDLTPPAEEGEATTESGAVLRPGSTLTAEALATAERTPTNTPTPSPTPTASPTPTPSNTPTPSPTATLTPSPTFTPTPFTGPTAVVVANGRALWLRRSPGGQRLVPLADGEVVAVTGSRANQDGVLWEEIRTGAGVLGWLEIEFLAVGEE